MKLIPVEKESVKTAYSVDAGARVAQWYENTRFVPPREPRISKPDIDAICELSLFVGSLFSSEINKQVSNSFIYPWQYLKHLC